MGLTKQSVGMGAVDSGLEIKKQTPDDKIIAIAGNPNVGKSTLFNNLTGMNQHTGNWPGKTVTNAQGYCKTREHSYVLVDIPGTYSLMAHSTEEEVARNFICFGGSDGIVVVCDATCLERNLNLVLQTMEISDRVLVCVNLMDEAARKNITIDLKGLSEKLGVPVAGTIARKKQSLDQLMKQLDDLVEGTQTASPYQVEYSPIIEQAIAMAEPAVKGRVEGKVNSRWLTLKLLDSDPSLMKELREYLDEDILEVPEISLALSQAREHLAKYGITNEILKDRIVAALVTSAEKICRDTVQFHKTGYNEGDRKLDKILTSRFTGYPVMIGMLAVVFWLTITGANYPSQMLADALFRLQDQLTKAFLAVGAPPWLHGLLILGVYRVLAWVVSVMLPPMAIFFPLFTLLEDSGYLPRIAYNLDKPFKSCHACGKQALTMCMGFGCNAAGIVGCRIIDSPRERLIAMITNNFVPCNGRFPTLIAIISMFFVGVSGGAFDSMLSALLLTLFIVLGVCMTFAVSKVLSMTVLKGIPSSFTLELPPYRRPQIGKVIVRSIFDRTLFVLGRAIAVAAPAGLLIWIMANVQLDGITLLAHFSGFLDPFARLLGMDGVILMAFILGLPANEIVIPIIIMAYMAQGSLLEFDSLAQLRDLLVNNGWTWITAVSTMLFSLMHWPCTTTLLTIRKESGSLKWTVMSFLVPTVCAVVLCFAFATVARMFV
ncbi:MAG: ferrous iron transport protein B [Enterocloster clostridioformis]|uniref:ferrous iron transport protein B n=1 Tax=Enterocloster clostridioformis TaxID=1531 RepID=UPI0039924D87